MISRAKTNFSDRVEKIWLRSRFDELVFQNLPIVLLGVLAIYLIFLVSNIALLESPARWWMAGADGVVMILLLATWVALHKGEISPRHAHPLTAFFALVLLATDLLHFAVAPDAYLTVNFILLEIGVSAFILSLRWFVILSSLILAGWLGVFWVGGEANREWVTYGVTVVVAWVLAALVQVSRIRAFGRLELSYLRFKRLADAASDALVICRKGVVEDVNQNVTPMFGYSLSELKNADLGALVPSPPDCESESEVFETEGRKKSGENFPIEISSRLLEPGVNTILAITIRDITERKQAERTIEEQRRRMIQAARMSSLGEMAGGISHEINNPLTSVLSRAELMIRLIRGGRLESETLKKSLEQIRDDALRISAIIKGLLHFAREAGGDPFERAELNSILEEVRILSSERFKRQGVDLVIDCAAEGLKIECRPAQISQILVNLLNNAFDAVESPAVQSLKEKWVRIACADLGEQVEISVTDSGPGIPVEIQDKIMQPFFTTKGPSHGTGLGLSISKGLAEVHHGALELDRASRHTRFLVRLPKKQPKSEPRGSREPFLSKAS